MGLIRAVAKTIGGSLADQWLETIEPYEMDDQTVFTKGITMHRGVNKKGSSDVISNGSVVHVYDNQFMILTDGGRIVDYCAEPGYYTVDDSSAPSMFSGSLSDAVQDTFNRFRFGGGTPSAQKVFYINLQEIKGIKFGTRNPINYFDNFYNAELFLRAHGTYSIRITDPLKFYAEAVPRNSERVEIDEINAQYMAEFLEALQTSINQMSADGIRISYVASKGRELSKYMAEVLDDDWRQARGIEVESVGLASITYDEESTKLINMRNQGAMLGDPSIREGYMQGAIARGLEAAGSNANGSAAGFMGVGLGMQAGAGVLGAASAANQQQMQSQQQLGQGQAYGRQFGQNQAGGPANGVQSQGNNGQPMQGGAGWTCPGCGAVNTGKFCGECGKPAPAPKASWVCSCGAVNTGKFCGECGKPAPSAEWACPDCGTLNKGRFCSNCGSERKG